MSYNSNIQLVVRDSDGDGYREDPSQIAWSDVFGQYQTDSSPCSKKHSSQSEMQKLVAIILGYYNGNSYLPDQIRSILDQSHQNLAVFISDDCSHSKVDIAKLGLTADDVQKIWLGVRSVNVGFTNNFLGALSSIDSPFEYFAFSDQDDVWHYEKIADALATLTQYPEDKPVLYCARTATTDETCQADLGSSPLFEKPPSFANALVQSIGGGNTMVFNKAARDLIVKSITTNIQVVSHDWWCYQIVSGAGGVVYFDPKPCLKYRQHAENLVGSNNSWAARFIRIRGVLKGKFRNWNDINLAALSKNKNLLTPENKRCLDDFVKARQSGLFKRLFLFKRSGVYRQTLFDNLGLLLGVVINRI